MATVLIVNNNGGGKQDDAVPTANEVALQSPQDPGPAPFTPSVETEGVQAPAPASTPAQPATTRTGGAATTGSTAAATTPAGIRSVEGTSSGLYAGTMSKPNCDVEKLVSMTSTGDSGRAWASAQGIDQSENPAYLRSLTPAFLRVDTRVTNHAYKGGAAVGYQSVLQAGTSVLVDAQGVPRVRCGCGNPLKPPTLVSDAKYTGKAWAGFQPSATVVVVPAPKPVTEILLVNVVTGGWFVRVTGQIEIVDRPAQPPRGPLAPGVPPPAPMTPTGPSGSGSSSTSPSSSGSTSGSGSATGSGATSGTPSGSTSGSTGPSSGSATASTATPSSGTATASTAGATSSGATPSSASTGATTSAPPTSAAPTTAGGTPSTVTSAATATTATTTASTAVRSATGTTTTAATATAQQTAAVTPTCSTTQPSTLPPCPTPEAG
ncbi:DUF6777 domain-containing protein [Kitasatospora sp. NPDC058201]|uniref:DUF6777 domain-containing protein n=1 Tax=unclassified Kitasatospora TaxID=2633591 RepID=UPI00364655CC